ncbi:hypothetical protein [Mucilaginibacter aquaedulcis]|uniref:hypothetical protein n=1 Tax=Mucilaginibacter aquaedulcis TaxID=1187081 RepID=UPI0025B3D531|nr:hypothetical protein [Mucilaginibacter aquaedulcis]MDN3549395.1 hypothetical protein [Mucilaginibacter aquaedulcis]
MVKLANYNLYTPDGDRSISIKPVHQHLPGSSLNVTGVFKLKEGMVDLGEIVFDDEMRQWEYTGLGDLTHEQALEIATFIQGQVR